MGAATDSFAHCLIIANKLELQLEILSMSKVSTSLLWKSIDSAYSSFCLSGVTSCGSHWRVLEWVEVPHLLKNGLTIWLYGLGQCFSYELAFGVELGAGGSDLSHATVPEESQTMREKLEMRNRVLQQAKENGCSQSDSSVSTIHFGGRRHSCKEVWRACAKSLSSHSWPLIIALTASSEEQVRERCLQVGMNGLIRKPVLLQGLADVNYNDSFKRGGGVGL
ncbi:hypothetical protein FXO37_18105 [Capsicum annuum]|nr:hypothetical protein FXO37_18105 [Capsicum annuum]